LTGIFLEIRIFPFLVKKYNILEITFTFLDHSGFHFIDFDNFLINFDKVQNSRRLRT